MIKSIVWKIYKEFLATTKGQTGTIANALQTIKTLEADCYNKLQTATPKYKLIKRIGSGSFGTVYDVFDFILLADAWI